MAIGQQRSLAISKAALNFRDHLFMFRGLHALTVGQFAHFWSYYDGFLRCASESSRGDRLKFSCLWRGCPASYAMYLLKQDQVIILAAHEEHHHSVMDAVNQLPTCTVVRYQVLRAITDSGFGDSAIIMANLKNYTMEELLRSGLDQIKLGYVEQLRDMLCPRKNTDDEPAAKRQRLE